MTTELAQKLEGVRDFKKILETVVKEIGETYCADVSQIVLSNPLDRNITSICEYKLYPEASADQMPVSMSFPLPLEGSGLGSITLARRNQFHENEVNWITITLAELCDVIRHAQINDVVQRDTFRNTFLFEIQNVMQYSLGLGDALFMVVNILGKVLQSSRCLFICIDDSKAGWKCYEFWQRERVQSCQEYGWPTTDSPIIARSLLTTSPLILHEANQNSHLTPAQEELQLLGVRSLLGVPLKSDASTHGCIILQHCDCRHAWTRSEIDMVQNVADTVAEALAKLPEEKRAHEPIMRLHQREVIPAGEEKESILAVRRALRGALGSTSIPSAQKSGSMPKPDIPAPVQAKTAPSVTAPAPPAPAPSALAPSAPAPPAPAPSALAPSALAPPLAAAKAATAAPTPMAPSPATGATTAYTNALPEPSSGSVAPAAQNPAAAAGPAWQAVPVPTAPAAMLPIPATTAARTPPDPPIPSMVPGDRGSTIADLANSLEHQAAEPAPSNTADEVSASLQSLLGGMRSGEVQPTQTHYSAGAASDVSPSTGTAAGGNLDTISTPAAGAPPPTGNSAWGNLDAIPTPAAGSAKGLGSTLGKRPSGNGPASPLLASLHRDKSKFQPEKGEFVDGGTIQIDEAQAEAKLKQLLSTSNPTSDYIFATTGLDTRILGRIDGWVSQVEAKDKYMQPHAMQVAEYSLAIGRLLGLPQSEVDTIRLAAIVHDVGKLGLPANILQKPEDELSDTELLLIMKHPIDGANLLEGFPELMHVAPIVLAHHEEYDGNGYPAGLAGEQILLAARIIHVASDYHSMVCSTQFRTAMGPQEAQQTLLAGSGKAYDPNIVHVLIACVQQGLVVAGR